MPNTKWALEEKLGEGGFGEVWLGRHETLKQQRVFKFCFRADRVRSLKREMTLFRLLKERIGDHPNIVRLLEVYLDEPPFYIIEPVTSFKKSRLILAAICASMGRHIMKTTIEIADALFERAQRFAQKEKTTFRSLTEQGLRLVLKEKDAKPRKLPPLVTVGGTGLTNEFKNAPWEKIRAEIYRGHGA